MKAQTATSNTIDSESASVSYSKSASAFKFDGDSDFPLTLWAHAPVIMPVFTTNRAEYYHGHLRLS